MTRNRTITKIALAFAVACLLTITPQPVFSQYYVDQLYQQGVAAYNRGDFLSAESTFLIIIHDFEIQSRIIKLLATNRLLFCFSLNQQHFTS